MGILGKLKLLSRLRSLFSYLIVLPLSFVLAGITVITGRISGRDARQRWNWQRARGLLNSTAVTPEEITLLIGTDIGWADIVGQVFRVRDFDRGGTTIGPRDKARAGSRLQPYGYLLVESPIFNQPAKLPICHRDDFLLASTVFDDPKFAHLVTQAELLVTYVPKQRLPGGAGFRWHALHYVIVPPGTLQFYYQVGGNAHVAKPAPEKLFGRFVYSGEIGVGVNHDPQLT